MLGHFYLHQALCRGTGGLDVDGTGLQRQGQVVSASLAILLTLDFGAFPAAYMSR
ncbi:MAG: hypothetical protein IPG51_14375 [Chloroflexi bacterium]|nr:hypothetical protein [Chloroflexota bacterium]